MSSRTSASLNSPVTSQMHQDFPRLQVGQTVSQALDALRRNPPAGRVIYFYVVDKEGRLAGVIPTRRLILSPSEVPLADIMVRPLISLPAQATVLEACEFFILYRLLALPVVDEEQHLLGVVDIDLYTEELTHLNRLPALDRLVAPLTRFLRIEASAGLVLLAFTAAALFLANSPFSTDFRDFWQTPVGLHLGQVTLDLPLVEWVNDGLMTLFFFVVGLEIKRELVMGELREVRKALLPVVAALGGMIVPALVYLVCLWGGEGKRGWGIPMATDIAFAVGFLTLLGRRVPAGLKALLLTLAIADDIGAVVLIAVVYSTKLHVVLLAAAVIGAALIPLLQRLGLLRLPILVLLGILVWLALLESGVHPTIAGVVVGLLTPTRPEVARQMRLDVVGDLFARLRRSQRGNLPEEAESLSPLEKLETWLHPWVAFVIMPGFALANAGVKVEAGELGRPWPWPSLRV